MLSIPFFACLPTFTPMRTVFSIFFFLPRHFIHGNTDWIARKRWGRHKKKSRKFQTKQKEEEIGRWLRDGKENGAPLPRAPSRNEALILTCSFAYAHLHALICMRCRRAAEGYAEAWTPRTAFAECRSQRCRALPLWGSRPLAITP